MVIMLMDAGDSNDSNCDHGPGGRVGWPATAHVDMGRGGRAIPGACLRSRRKISDRNSRYGKSAGADSSVLIRSTADTTTRNTTQDIGEHRHRGREAVTALTEKDNNNKEQPVCWCRQQSR